MTTNHKIIYADATNLSNLQTNSIQLMITSPPYPMVEMWDESFSKQNPEIKVALESKDGARAFELMHQILDKVWDETYRVLASGGIACINIGDATRTIEENFQLYNSHSRILNHCMKIGFQSLPSIIWRKQTNAPNKFMGSGMLPPGAYVTLEHEHILILRKGAKKSFTTVEEKRNRQESSFFWEERNEWFSDVWLSLKGTKQRMDSSEVRERSGAYPFELAYRLINMFSVKGDTVLDPFAGTGTTMLAAIAAERNSIGVELDAGFSKIIKSRMLSAKESLNFYLQERISKHLDFINKRSIEKGVPKYKNENHGFEVITRQEINLKLNIIKTIRLDEKQFLAEYHQADIVENKNLNNLGAYIADVVSG